MAYIKNEEDVKRVLDYTKAGIQATPDLFVDFSKVYLSEFGADSPICTSCPDGFSSAFDLLEDRLYKHNNQLKTQKMKAGNLFQLKDETHVYSPRQLRMFTPLDCTDDNAISLLIESPGNIKNFQKFPPNWEALVKAKVEEQAGKSTAPATTGNPVTDFNNALKAELEAKTVAMLKDQAKEAGATDEDMKPMKKADLVNHLYNKLAKVEEQA